MKEVYNITYIIKLMWEYEERSHKNCWIIARNLGVSMFDVLLASYKT